MLRGIFDTIASKISNLNPIKQFIKYALDKTLNEFLKKELTLQDFKNGPLNLQNIQINTEKINKSYLVSSPYIMHYGIIGNLKITLPPLSQLSTQSIQINVSQIQVTLKPNKKFSENFKEKILQLHQINLHKYDVQQKQVQGEISETGPVDFFKQLLKKIIMNIKVKVSNIAIKLYMNTPSEDKKSPQFYLMLKVPLIYLDKKQDKQLRKNETQEISFNILTPQVSVHLLSQDMKFPDYSNLHCKPSDFPINYPTVNHPKTILLIGSSSVPQDILTKIPQWKKDGSINNKGFTQIGFKLTTDYKKKTKEVSLHLKVANIEVMVTPVQIKIMSRFVAQILEFKKILQSIIQQLKFQGAQQSITLNRKKSKNTNNSDLFSSIIMNLNHDISSSQYNRQSGDLFKSMIKEDKIIRQSRREFNLQFQKQMKSAMKQVSQGMESMTIQFQAIQFKESVRIDIQFASICLYILKYSTDQDYLRIWKDATSQQIINKSIGCDYFMFVIKKIDAKIKVKQKDTAVNVKSLHLYHVKLHEVKDGVSDDSFYDVCSSFDFESSRVASRSKSTQMKLNQIKKFKMSQNGHYCVEQIVAISQNQSQLKFQQQNIKKYSIMPKLHYTSEDAYVLYKPAISVHLDSKQKYFKINFQVVTVSVNLQLILDFLNIAFPLLAYKRLAQMINFKRNQIIGKQSLINETKNYTSKRNIFQSMYQYRVDIQTIQQMQSQNKNALIIEIAEAKIGFRKNQVCKIDNKGANDSNFGDLVKKDKEKIFEQQSFSKICFCSLNDTGIYLQLQNMKVQKKQSAIKVSCKIIDIGIMKISKSQITSLSSILSIKATKTQQSIRVLKQMTHCQSLIIFVPELNARFTQDDIVNIVSLVTDSIKIVSNIIIYKDYLEREMMMLEQKSSELAKKHRKNEGSSQKQFKIYVQKVSVQLDYCNFLLEQILLSINQQAQQSFVCKISKIVASINRQPTPKVKLGQFVNDEIVTKQYLLDNSHKEKKVLDSDIFLEIWDQEKPILPFKVQDRHAFFEKLNKQNFSLTFKMIKKETDRHENNYKKKQSGGEGKSKLKWSNNTTNSNTSKNQKFKFNQFNGAIQQEGQKKIMILNLTKDVRISLCNALQLKKYTPKIEKFINYLATKTKQVQQRLKSQTLSLIQRKHSSQIESQSIQIMAKFTSPIIIDIRPDFISNQNERIFSNMRSIVTINLHDEILVQINKDKNQKQISIQLSLCYYFLKNSDRQIALNPLIIREDRHLNQLGFKILLQVNRLHMKLNLYNTNKSITLGVKSIFGEASIQTLCLIQLHLQHLINHHIKHQNGISVSEIYDGEDFCVLQYDAETDPDLEKLDDVVIVGQNVEQQLQIQDLTGALQLYQEKLTQKKNQQTTLRSRALIFNQLQSPEISIQSITLQKICFRISCQNDFDFVKQANQMKRTRNKQDQQVDYYVFILINLYIQADIAPTIIKQDNDKNISSFIKLQKLKINFSKQKNYGHFNLKFLQQLNFTQNFVIINSQNQICIVLQKKPERILIKVYCLRMNIGGTTEIISTLKKVKVINQQIQRSGWRKIYQQKKQIKKQNEQIIKQSKIIKKDLKKQIQRILILIPESEVKITFQYGNLIKIVDEQIIKMKQFVLNEQINDKFQIKRQVKNWLKMIMKNNIGSLISGTALNLLIKLFSQLIALNISWISKLFGFFFSSQ